jgi:hypothetical protein
VDAALLAGGSPFGQFARQAGSSEQEPMILATGGLKDFRILDSSNQEVPYLMILPPVPESKWTEGQPTPLAWTKKTSGFQVDLGRPLLIDRLRLGGLPAPLVKRCFVEASNDAGSWKLLRPDATVFDLPSEKLRSLEIEFDQNRYRYLKITWDDSASARIPMPQSVSVRQVSAGSLPPRLEIPIGFEIRGSEPGISRYRLHLPGARMPILGIRLSAGGGNVLREAHVTEARLSGEEMIPFVLGTATLRREVRGEILAAEMTVSITPPQEAQLDLVIRDGQNPPLDITGITAVFAYLPWIYFESEDGKPLTARYGHPGLEEPRYDLEAARASASKAQTVEARWGEALPRGAEEEEASASEEMPGAGSAIDVAGFRYSRSIAVGKPGLSALLLDAAVLAHGRITDLRIVGANANQIPYLVEKADEPLSLDLPALEKTQAPRPRIFPGRAGTGTWSYYRLQFPYSDLPPARLVFTTSARVFNRNLTVLIERNPLNERQEPWTQSVAQATWSHADPEMQAPALTLRIPSLKTTEAMLVVEEGDNSPLPVTSAKLLLPAHRLRFFRSKEADLKLYYGRNDMGAPRYDLAILAPRLIGAAAEEVKLGPEVELVPGRTQPLSLRFFWGILIAAVLILLILISRLAGKAGNA